MEKYVINTQFAITYTEILLLLFTFTEHLLEIGMLTSTDHTIFSLYVLIMTTWITYVIVLNSHIQQRHFNDMTRMRIIFCLVYLFSVCCHDAVTKFYISRLQ